MSHLLIPCYHSPSFIAVTDFSIHMVAWLQRPTTKRYTKKDEEVIRSLDAPDAHILQRQYSISEVKGYY